MVPSLIAIAVGAILRFAVTVHTTGFNVHTVGVILMVVGGVGALLSLAFWSSWGGFQTTTHRRTTSTVPGDTVVETTRTMP